jgi:N,N'-diacetyllegionaminate synthase
MKQVFIIAEAGVNHNGDVDMALELVRVAAECGANAVKFQTFSADKLVSRGTAKAEYQERDSAVGDQHSMLEALELSELSYRRISQACQTHGIEFMSTPFDEGATEMLLNLGMQRIKIPSGELTNLPFLRFLARKGLPLILSTGMATMEEIDEAVSAIQGANQDYYSGLFSNALTILHCTSNYPTLLRDVNLRAMKAIADRFQVLVGYSDHTLGITVATAAVGMGASVIEKHFTLDKALMGPDHKASLDPAELKILVEQIRAVEECLGSSVKTPTPSEIPIRALVRRSVTLVNDLPSGAILKASDLCLMRPGTGIEPDGIALIAGRTLSRSLSSGTTLQWSDFV